HPPQPAPSLRAGPRAGQRSRRMPAVGRPPLDLLPLAPPAGPLRTRAAAAAGAPPAPDAECDSTHGGATHSGLGTGSARLGSRPPQPGAGSGEVGRPQGLGERALAGPQAAWAEHSGQTPEPGLWLRGTS